MKKEVEIEKLQKTITTTYYCDYCEKELIKKRIQCNICGKDICPDCIGHVDDETDYFRYQCNQCWNIIGTEYRQKIDELEQQIDKLYKEWYKKC